MVHFKYVISRNELRYLRFHDLRHTCTSLLLANHIPLKSTQDWLDHANFETTANIYLHLDFSSRVESADMIAGVLDKAESSFTRNAELVKHSKRGRKSKNDCISTALYSRQRSSTKNSRTFTKL